MRETFPIVSLPFKASFLLYLIVVLSGITTVLFVWLLLTTRRMSVELTEESVLFRAGFYSRSIPLSGLDVTNVRIVDLSTEPQLRPVRRTSGVGLPSFKLGWFRLANGSTAIVGLTQSDQVVYVPTRLGYSLLLSVEDHQRFISQLRNQKAT
jgi:hypothetical protein